MAPTTKSRSGRGITFGLIFFSSSEAPFSDDKYRLVIESTRFADQHDFSSVWIPERHFTRDGWLYPNPAILQAALARETRQIHLRAGSVVLPLHNPLRVAEEWAMVDNLSGGRVGVSFASGWHPNDFALAPDNYVQRSEIMYHGIEMVRKLWRGEAVQVKGGDGGLVEVRTYPSPIQREIPIWITAAGNPKTFAGAGEIGANLLTHMYNQSVEELADKIRIYREARAKSGYDPASGLVSVMLHTFVGKNEETVRAQLQGPFCEYLKSASYLVNAIAYSRGQTVDLSSLSEQDLNDYLLFVFDRLVSTQRVLFGTPESCLPLVNQLKEAGVDEIACQMDFGVDSQLVLESMPYLAQLKEMANGAFQSAPLTMEALSSSHPTNGRATSTPNTLAQTNYIQEQQPQRGRTEDSGGKGDQVQQGDQLQSIQQRCQESISPPDFYQLLSQRGIQLAASFQGIAELKRGDGEALGLVKLPPQFAQEADLYQVHPTLLDACFQVLIAALPHKVFTNEEALYLPTGMRSFQLYAKPGAHVWSHAKLLTSAEQNADLFEGDVRILDEQGEVIAEARGLQLQSTGATAQRTTTSTTTSATSTPTTAFTGELNKWLYELQWQQAALPPADSLRATRGGRTWLLFMDGLGVGKELAVALEGLGDACIHVTPGYKYAAMGGQNYQVNPTQPGDIARLLAEVQRRMSVHAIVYLWGLDIKALSSSAVDTVDTIGTVDTIATLEADQEVITGGALTLVQALAQQTAVTSTKMWIVTRGAQAVAHDEEHLSVAQSPLWGLGKTCALEHPEQWGGLIDLDPSATIGELAAQLLAGIASTPAEDQVAFRRGQSYVARMVRSSELTPQAFTITHDASYLITGGLWGLGLEVARWLAGKGGQHLILLGRAKLPERALWNQLQPGSRQARQVAGIIELERIGAHVHYATVDVTQQEQLASFLAAYRQQGHPPIRGVMHAASVWQDAQGQSLVRPLVNLSTDALMEVLRPKVVGGWLLHTLFKDQKLDFFVSFSSGASLFGSAAQGNYAAAGEFLDQLAHYRRAQGQTALSVDWGAVSETGFGATTEGQRVHEYWEGHGIQRITPQQVLAALELLIPQSLARVGVLKLDWQLLREFYPQITALPLVRQLIDGKTGAKTQAKRPASTGSAILVDIQQASVEQRAHVLQRYLSAQVAGVLRMPSETLDPNQPLTALGLDSLMAIELKNKLELELAVRIPIVTFLQGPSIAQFTAQLLDQLNVQASKQNKQGEQQAEKRDQVATVVRADSLGKRDAAELLSQLDRLSDQDVDASLNQLQPADGEHDTNGQNGNGHTGTHLDLSPQDAEALLAQLDQLSDEQVDALLGQIAQKEE
ncbi:MAG: hypothetical protein NVSMB44_25460 [Ktedonobacteraceae bacterium]